MITIPVHDLLLLPGVMFYFKKDMFPDRRITAEDVGEDILFMMLKEEKKASELQPDDFYPIGVSGKIEGIDDEGNVSGGFESRGKVYKDKKTGKLYIVTEDTTDETGADTSNQSEQK